MTGVEVIADAGLECTGRDAAPWREYVAGGDLSSDVKRRIPGAEGLISTGYYGLRRSVALILEPK